MLPHSAQNDWVRRTKWLTQALIISGTLNIGLIATFAYFVLKEKQDSLAIELSPAKESKESLATNLQLIRAYSLLPYHELLLRLENHDLIEEGLTKRDLALACLVTFHHFNLDKALGSIPLQKRTLPFDAADIAVYPGLADSQFQALLQYARTEKWPFTSQGLFNELKRSPAPRDPSLLDTFYLSPEFAAAYTLLTRTGVNLTREQTVDLLCEGEWKTLSDLTQQQRIAMDLSPERKRVFFIDYLRTGSKLAAKFLLEYDPDFILKRFDDGQILALLDLYSEKSPSLEALAKELLASPRTDTVWRRSASLLYTFAGETLPEPYDHQAALTRFLPKPTTPETPLIVQTSAPIPSKKTNAKTKKKMHTIEPGDNLWKIARKYHVTVDEIMRANRMESEKLRTGKQLEIPEKHEKR